MYANMHVTVARRDGTGEPADFAVCEITTNAPGKALLVLDDPNDEGDTAEPIAELEVDLTTHAIQARADF